MMHESGRSVVRLIRGGLAGVLLAASAAGCDPCAGIADCRQTPRVALQGQIVDNITGAGVSGARIDVVYAAGSRTETDSVSVTTDAGGRYEASLGDVITEDGPAIVAITVTAEETRYRVPGVVVPPLNVRGDVYLLPTWVRRPYFPHAGEVWKGNDPAIRRTDAAVEFRRTGGVAVSGPGWRSDDRYLSRTNTLGIFPLFGPQIVAESFGALHGILSVQNEDGSWRVRGSYRILPTVLRNPGPSVVVFRGGPFFPYVGEAWMGDSAVAHVDVTFRRVGGVEGTPSQFTEHTDSLGRFYLRHFGPADTGSVTFDLEFTTSPAPGSPQLTPSTVRMTLPVLAQDSFGEPIGIFHVDRPTNPLDASAAAP